MVGSSSNTGADKKEITRRTRKRACEFVGNVYIADGFHTDCQRILKQFADTDSLRYEDFCRVWKDTNFSYVFCGRPTTRETAEVSEEILFVAKSYMKPTNTFRENVGALYLLYALVFLQPIEGFASVYVTPSHRDMLLDIEKQARQCRHQDVLYVLGRLLLEGCTFHLAERMYGLDPGIKRYMEGSISVERLKPHSLYKPTFKDELSKLRDINNIMAKYKKLKEEADTGDMQLNTTLTDYDKDYSEIVSSLNYLARTGRYKSTNRTAAEWQAANSDEREDRIANIKKRAMKIKVQGRLAQLSNKAQKTAKTRKVSQSLEEDCDPEEQSEESDVNKDTTWTSSNRRGNKRRKLSQRKTVTKRISPTVPKKANLNKRMKTTRHEENKNIEEDTSDSVCVVPDSQSQDMPRISQDPDEHNEESVVDKDTIGIGSNRGGNKRRKPTPRKTVTKRISPTVPKKANLNKKMKTIRHEENKNIEEDTSDSVCVVPNVNPMLIIEDSQSQDMPGISLDPGLVAGAPELSNALSMPEVMEIEFATAKADIDRSEKSDEADIDRSEKSDVIKKVEIKKSDIVQHGVVLRKLEGAALAQFKKRIGKKIIKKI